MSSRPPEDEILAQKVHSALDARDAIHAVPVFARLWSGAKTLASKSDASPARGGALAVRWIVAPAFGLAVAFFVYQARQTDAPLGPSSGELAGIAVPTLDFTSPTDGLLVLAQQTAVGAPAAFPSDELIRRNE